MTRARIRIALLVLGMLAVRPAFAQTSAADDDLRMSVAGGAWHPGKFVPCADGVVTDVGPRLETTATGPARFDSGVGVEFKLPTAPRFLNGQPFATARVVHYQSELGNDVMQKQRAGDRVQVCLVSFPTPTHDARTGAVICDPNVDARGFVFRVYDYRQHAAYLGPDSQHSCGGA